MVTHAKVRLFSNLFRHLPISYVIGKQLSSWTRGSSLGWEIYFAYFINTTVMTLWRYFHTFLLSSVAVIYLIHNQLKRKKRFTIEQLHRAAALGDISQLKTILGAGQVPVNRRNEEGTTPLMLAIANGHKECAEILLKHHADPAIRRITGTHALYFACQSGLSHMDKAGQRL